MLWRGPSDGNGSPVIGGGAVWVTHYAPGGGTLYALNQATGKVEYHITIGPGLPHFSSLALSGGTAYISTLSGVTAVNGARPGGTPQPGGRAQPPEFKGAPGSWSTGSGTGDYNS